MATITIPAGKSVPLSLQADDGCEDLHPRALVTDSMGVVVGTSVVLTHRHDGLYSAMSQNLFAPGNYSVSYTCHLSDDEASPLDPTRDIVQDLVYVKDLDPPRLGAAYDGTLLFVEASVSSGARVLGPSELVGASLDIYDSDDSVLASVSDGQCDSAGVFRMSHQVQLEANRLYYVRVIITTANAGTVIANKGLATTW